MISILVLFRNARESGQRCIASLLWSVRSLGIENNVEFVFVDDCSDDAEQVPAMLHQFRRETTAPVNISRFRKHLHYSHGLARGLSEARGAQVMFFSHDMLVPPACIAALLRIAAVDPTNGIVRPTSRHMDTVAAMQVDSPLPLRNLNDVAGFAGLMSKVFQNEVHEAAALIGDAMLISRAVIDRIGVTDTRFYGFMADVDYGVRAVRAGFHNLIAPGAWLHHEGGAALYQMTGEARNQAADKNLTDAIAMLRMLHDKWDPTVEGGLTDASMKHLTTMPSDVPLFVPPPQWGPELCETL